MRHIGSDNGEPPQRAAWQQVNRDSREQAKSAVHPELVKRYRRDSHTDEGDQEGEKHNASVDTCPADDAADLEARRRQQEHKRHIPRWFTHDRSGNQENAVDYQIQKLDRARDSFVLPRLA